MPALASVLFFLLIREMLVIFEVNPAPPPGALFRTPQVHPASASHPQVYTPRSSENEFTSLHVAFVF